MSMRLDYRRKARHSRWPSPAPPGTRPPQHRLDVPPDGWQPVRSPFGRGLVVGADRAALRAAERVARRLSRRQFLTRVGWVSVLATLNWAGLVRGWPGARAWSTPCNNCNNHPCGPSPICSDTYCADHGNCKVSLSNVTHRRYNTAECAGADGTNNHWDENCCSCTGVPGWWKANWRCFDCCSPAGGLDCNSGCPSKRCICRKKLSEC